MKTTKILLSILFVLIIIACKPESNLSAGKVEDIALIGAEIEVEQESYEKNESNITVRLFDKEGIYINNDSINIIVNNNKAEFYATPDGFYGSNPYYNLKIATPTNKLYTVEVMLTNGKKYLLGTIGAISNISKDNIECNEQGNLSANTIIKWKNLENNSELLIDGNRSFRKGNIIESKSTTPIEQKIGNSGSYVFPKSQYIDSLYTITDLYIKFKSSKIGALNPKLLKGSIISISTEFKKTISFEKEK